MKTEKVPTIIFVDDDKRILEMIDEYFSIVKPKVQCKVYDSPIKVLNILRNEKVDLIFTDLKMPEMDGIEFLKNIRKVDQNIPVILVSAYATVSKAVEALKLGANDVLLKPINLESIKNIVFNYVKFDPRDEIDTEDILTNNEKDFLVVLYDCLEYSYSTIEDFFDIIFDKFNIYIDNELLVSLEINIGGRKYFVFKASKAISKPYIESIVPHNSQIINLSPLKNSGGNEDLSNQILNVELDFSCFHINFKVITNNATFSFSKEFEKKFYYFLKMLFKPYSVLCYLENENISIITKTILQTIENNERRNKSIILDFFYIESNKKDEV